MLSIRATIAVVIVSIIPLSGCSMGTPQRDLGMSYGPPPPGNPRIVGEPVPNWTPRHLAAARSGGESNPLHWHPIGPRPIVGELLSGDDDASGRVVSLAVDPRDGATVYAASASGGLWKTTNGGATWVPKTDELPILNHGCVALDPSNPEVVYLGTGEYTVMSAGDGVFRSLDGGVTFERIATTDEVGAQCSRIIIDPTNSEIIHHTGTGGYARSIDGGATWRIELNGACSDLALNPNDPSVVYVARHGDGVYRSADGGSSFERLSNGLPNDDVHRIVLSIAASNPQVLYAAIIDADSGNAGLRGLYKTTDGGESWSRLNNTPDFPRPQGWYDCFVGVDPTDEETVYCGGVSPEHAEAGVIKSTDGGSTWVDITFGDNGVQLHPDQHAIAFGPDGEIWIGNDGGVWSSLDGGQTWLNRNNRLSVTQNYTVAVHPTDSRKVMTGTQDNGTVARDLATHRWPQIITGDGGFLAYDFKEPFRRYTTFVGLRVFRLRPGTFFTEITGPWRGVDPVNFIAPMVMDPKESDTLLGGTNRVWRTTNADRFADWKAISSSEVAGGGTLNVIAIGPGDSEGPSNHIYTGASTGSVYFTNDAKIWNNRSAGLPSAGVTDIMVDPENSDVAYVSFGIDVDGRVYKTLNAGVEWHNMTGGLPAGVTPRALAIDWQTDPPGMYVGSGSGVYVSLDEGASWNKDGADLPNVNIGDLYIDSENREITAGTYGRGAWRSALPPTTGLIVEYPNGAPRAVPPGEVFDVDVKVVALSESPDTESGLLHYSIDGGAFVAEQLIYLGDNAFRGTLPPLPCGSFVNYFITFDTLSGGAISSPVGAPERLLSAVAAGQVLLIDDFETDLGWLVSGSADSGQWERGVPVGSGENGDPLYDFDASGKCYVTGNVSGLSRVVDATLLKSPRFNLTGLSDPHVTYARWYTNNQAGEVQSDVFTVEISNDDGATWTVLETVGPTFNDTNPEVDGGWTVKVYRVAPVLPLTGQLHIRFRAADEGGPTLIEAGLDMFAIVQCAIDPTCHDNIENQDEDHIDCGGSCAPCDCIDNVDCNDGVFCNGAETCDAFGVCQAAGDACPNEMCLENSDRCVECLSDSDCDDGIDCTEDACASDSCENIPDHDYCDNALYCDGAEVCDALAGCRPGDVPCPDRQCREETEVCTGPASVTCRLSSEIVPASATVTMHILLQNAIDVASYDLVADITRTSGGGAVTVACPDGTKIDSFRPDYVFAGAGSSVSGANCEELRLSATLLNNAVDVGSTPAYLGTYVLDVSGDTPVGGTFEITLLPSPATTILDSEARIIPYGDAPVCVLTIEDCTPIQYGDVNQDGTVDLLDILCLLDGFGGDVSNCTVEDVDIIPCGGDGEVTLMDILAVLDAFTQLPPPCPDPCVPAR